MKVEIKFGRYVKLIDKNDLILDNGVCFQVVTQQGARTGWIGHSPVRMSKKLFNELKKCDFIFLDVSKTKKANEHYNTPWLFYFRFDIDKMIASCGYKVVD